MYTREELISICEKAIIIENNWITADTPYNIAQIGKAWAYLKANCKFEVYTKGTKFVNLSSNDREIVFCIIHHDYDSMEDKQATKVCDTFFLPTIKVIEEYSGKDYNKVKGKHKKYLS